MDNETYTQRVEAALHGRVPRWPAIVALLVIAGAYLELSDSLALVSQVLIGGVVVAGIVLIFLARLLRLHRLVRPLAFALISVVTLAEAGSALLLVALLPRDFIPASHLLRDGTIIWGINIVTFALWYWEIDDGGPIARRLKPYESKDFLFPQQALGEIKEGGTSNWCPGFIDYFFLAFNHSTAFSPTDTGVLSRKAKILVIIQATISLMAVVVIISRAINAL
ncbi:MAG: hypothetical protein LC751_08830 [Actinobacteria bacterium]|nr:hypothetical protein [Actinomycetota bacterium]